MTAILLNNRYQILETLARGGFGETFLAIDTHMPSSRKCVIKKLKPAVQTTNMLDWLKERFGREAAILEDLGENSPQIPKLYAYFSDNSDFYLVQEWIEGVTLTQKHQQQGNLSEEEVTKILVNLLPVLDFIHSRRIIHRDIKPDNIILRNCDGLPVLIDFGVVKEAVATVVNPHGTAYSVALGTPGYMASEQAAGRPVYSSDLYSLGLTAIFLLSGKTPQYLEIDSQTGEILWRDAVGDIHSNLAMIIDKAIRFHPKDRFSSAKEMLAALKVPLHNQTTATVVVSPKGKAKQPLTPKPSLQTLPDAEVEKRFSIWRWLLSILLLGVWQQGRLCMVFCFFYPNNNFVLLLYLKRPLFPLKFNLLLLLIHRNHLLYLDQNLAIHRHPHEHPKLSQLPKPYPPQNLTFYLLLMQR